MHVVAVGRVVVGDQREDIQIGQGVADHDRFALIGGQRLHAFFVEGGLFEPQLGGCLIHFRFQVIHRGMGLSAKQGSYQ